MADREDLLPSSYASREVEERWYPFWESKGFFTPKRVQGKKAYTIVIPPPNVTGILHMGHALNNTLQDILIRWHRMKGVPTLWVPGTDHAGIATQNVVEKKLAQEGKTRFDLGRTKFVEEVWKWKGEYGSTIVRQLRKLGASCDWTRERFTMDEGLSRAVREAFVRLYAEGLIYRGNYIINWCPRCQTALSDEEAPYKEIQGKLFYYHYLVRDASSGELRKDEQVMIATTRPETMLGDTAVAVHPKDGRYRGLEQKEVYLPLQNRRLRVIRDAMIDPEFGTGMVKVTPAHDPNDFEMGHRHKLEFRNILTADGHVNELGAPYQGLDRFEARKQILEDLRQAGLLVKEETHLHKVPHCYRCHTVVEPYLSKQWFVRMRPLAARALQAQKAHQVRFYPARWTKVYVHWLKNIRDWCVSRQIWWGHQIPVWYCDACIEKTGNEEKGLVVSRKDPAKCPRCGGPLRRDEDVLDTWFSSWLWPFSTLGWPDRTADLAYFYPTSDLATAQEILFFWVARMIMAGLHFMKKVPFRNVYIHGTVRTDAGQKMSKSLGNAIDPLEVIGGIGADALRFSIIMLTASGQDAYLSEEKFDLGRNFTNKIWNAARFSLTHLKGFRAARLRTVPRDLPVVDRWILSRQQRVVKAVDEALGAYRFNDAATALYHFFWHDFCDWYLELIKPVLQQEGAEREKTLACLLHVFETTLRLLHPFMPYLTEELWGRFRKHAVASPALAESAMISPWPKPARALISAEAEKRMDVLRRAVAGIRDLRARLDLPPQAPLDVVIRTRQAPVFRILQEFSGQIRHLARLQNLATVSDFKRTASDIGAIFKDMEIYLRTAGVIDPALEREKIRKRIEEASARLGAIESRLSSRQFVSRAPREVVDKEKARCSELKELLARLEDNLTLFRSSS